MAPSSHEWPARLAPACIDRDAALAELRTLLIKGLHTGLSGRAGADEGFIEDVAQMSLVRILDHLAVFEGRSAFTTWALAIALRVALIQSELTPLQRDVLLAELNAMPQDEIATQLGRNRNTIYKLGHDARRALKRAFEAAGYSAADVLGVFAETSNPLSS